MARPGLAGAGVAGAAGLGARGLAAAGGAYGVARITASSIKDYADLDRRMRRVGLTAEATGGQVAAATGEVKRLAFDTAMPLDDVVKGLEALVAQGRSLPQSMSFLPAVTRTAQAAGAEVEDIAKSADAVSTHLKIGAQDMQSAFDVLVAGGKAGQFELKDLARYLPSLAPAAKAVGLEGLKGLTALTAMLQILRKGSGTSEEAAASMNNILQKMTSEETQKKFKKMGVNLEEALEKGKKEGKNLLEVFEDATWKAIGGDLAKIPKVISDMEFARGMRAILSMRGEWQKMAQTITANAPGSTMKDFAQVADDAAARIQRLSQSWSNFKTSFGAAIAPGVIPALERIQQKLDEIRNPTTASPGDKRAAGRQAFIEEAVRNSPLFDKDGAPIRKSGPPGKTAEFFRWAMDPKTWGYGTPGNRDKDLADARWNGTKAAIHARVRQEEEALARPGQISGQITTLEGQRGSGPYLKRAMTERELPRLRQALAEAKQKAAEIRTLRERASAEYAEMKRRVVSGAFGIDGPQGATGTSVGGSGMFRLRPRRGRGGRQRPAPCRTCCAHAAAGRHVTDRSGQAEIYGSRRRAGEAGQAARRQAGLGADRPRPQPR
jgi:TP901 family phage tail tape measure protein